MLRCFVNTLQESLQ